MRATKTISRSKPKKMRVRNSKQDTKSAELSRFVKTFYREHGKIMTKLAYE